EKFAKHEIVHYRTEDSRWKRKRRHQGPSLEATSMMVELSQCHADKKVGQIEFSLFKSKSYETDRPNKVGSITVTIA
ncbi:hypothetical protein NC653_029905, partial [Populus alba x Populus x berolinensis]